MTTVIAAQAGCASFAASTAGFTSAAPDRATWQISAPVAGSIFANVRPSAAGILTADLVGNDGRTAMRPGSPAGDALVTIIWISPDRLPASCASRVLRPGLRFVAPHAPLRGRQ